MTRALLVILVAACGSSPAMSTIDAPDNQPPSDGRALTDGSGNPDGTVSAGSRTVIVVTFENKDSTEIYGDTTDAPYINGLMANTAAFATKFTDELPSGIVSEPHYVWMEAGTNALPDHTFTTDSDVSAANSTSSTAHLSTQLDAKGLTWTAYQEGITTGACPIKSSGLYAAKHDPFVFFQDVAGSPPSATNARCGQHHKSIADLAGDVAAGTLPNYTFITPNLCNDMHGGLGCSAGFSTTANVKAGDTWAAANVPALIAYTHSHNAILLLVWDEGDANSLIPFLAIGDHVVKGTNATMYTHSSMVKTIEEFLGVPVLPSVASATDFAAMFDPGYLTSP